MVKNEYTLTFHNDVCDISRNSDSPWEKKIGSFFL